MRCGSLRAQDRRRAEGDQAMAFVGDVGAPATRGPDGPGTYPRKHEPAISLGDISSNPARCADIKDFTSCDPMVANFELIVPNLENDMHNGTTLEGDDFLRG